MPNQIAYTTYWIAGLGSLIGASLFADNGRWGGALFLFGAFLVCCTGWLSEKIDDKRL